MYINQLNNYLKNKYGEKIYKLSLNAGLTCPNRDGRLDTRGCIFCSKGGSGDFAANPTLSITEQIESAKTLVEKKIKTGKYIAYFQAYSNTYGPYEKLRKIYYEAINHPDIVALSIATRPDCLDEQICQLLFKLNKIKPIYIELGLQTSNQTSAKFIRRGYDNSCFEQAVKMLNGLNIVVHIIIGLPHEEKSDIINTIHYVNRFPIHGVKLQLLHILSDTDLYDYYLSNPFHILTLEEYGDLLIDCIKNLREDIVIHRLTGDGPKKLLVAPTYSTNKKLVLNYINKRLKDEDVTQGSLYTQHGGNYES